MKTATRSANVALVRRGQRVGKYVLGERIARGGMAEVWAARVEGPGGFVKSLALKFILESFTGDTDLERLFVNEARVAASLSHANLVGVFDFDKLSGPDADSPARYYIAMERVEGHDLRRVLQVGRHKGKRLPPAIALHVAAEVLKGLGYVHERRDESGSRCLGLVHRDVSPHNVLIGMGGEVKLSDFGIVKAMAQNLGTESGMVRGKLAYASPEQLRSEAVDQRADQFGLGVTLWEMLADRRLFEGANEGEIAGKVLNCEIPPLPDIPPAVEAMVRRMLAPRPADRFPSTAQALAAVLAAPGYVPDPAGLAEIMHDLFAAKAMAVPPTVPMHLAEPGAVAVPRGLAETNQMDRDAPPGPPVAAARGGPGGRVARESSSSRRGHPQRAGAFAEARQRPSSGAGGAGGTGRSGSRKGIPVPMAPASDHAIPVGIGRDEGSNSGYVSGSSPVVPSVVPSVLPSVFSSWIDHPQLFRGRAGRVLWTVPVVVAVAAAAVVVLVAARKATRPDAGLGPRAGSIARKAPIVRADEEAAAEIAPTVQIVPLPPAPEASSKSDEASSATAAEAAAPPVAAPEDPVTPPPPASLVVSGRSVQGDSPPGRGHRRKRPSMEMSEGPGGADPAQAQAQAQAQAPSAPATAAVTDRAANRAPILGE